MGITFMLDRVFRMFGLHGIYCIRWYCKGNRAMEVVGVFYDF